MHYRYFGNAALLHPEKYFRCNFMQMFLVYANISKFLKILLVCYSSTESISYTAGMFRKHFSKTRMEITVQKKSTRHPENTYRMP